MSINASVNKVSLSINVFDIQINIWIVNPDFNSKNTPKNEFFAKLKCQEFLSRDQIAK